MIHHATVIEVPNGRTSWYYLGIRVQTVSKQTVGFPNFTPIRTEIVALHARWDPFAYAELIELCPWDSMWEDRVQYMVFFRYDDLSRGMVRALEKIMNFMSKWRREFWERHHWVTMTISYNFADDLRSKEVDPDLLQVAQQLYQDRKIRGAAFQRAKVALVDEVKKVPGYGPSIWFEPGLWVIPACTCDWILVHPDQGLSFSEQLAELDKREPARTRWATRQSDDIFLDLAPSRLTKQLLNSEEQGENSLPNATEFPGDA